MNDLFARAGTPLYNRIGSNTILPQTSSFCKKHLRVQQFSKRQLEGLVSDSHQHPCASSESTRSTHTDKSEKVAPLLMVATHSSGLFLLIYFWRIIDYSSELFSSTANDSVILVCSDSSSFQFKEPEAVYGPGQKHLSDFGASLKESIKSIHTRSSSPLLLNHHSNTSKDVINDSSSAMFVTNSETNAETGTMELDQPIIICSESTNDSRNVLEASSDSTDSSSCDELSGCSSDECGDLLSNRLYRLRKRKCPPVQSHPKHKRAKISDSPQTRVAGKRTRKALSESRKKRRKRIRYMYMLYDSFPSNHITN